uniref:Uncharacterized protein n=1 Tax=Phenylobacterium glaciei TaxID=2803784 RepID=A0A974P1T9_9CAUL|nr:hypothetical protein JKL49_18675 [Phenylobacterium glaciei]
MLAVTVGMLLYALAGLCAFWTRRILPVMLVIQKLMFLLGGLFAPITLYPDWLRKIAEATPSPRTSIGPGCRRSTPRAPCS